MEYYSTSRFTKSLVLLRQCNWIYPLGHSDTTMSIIITHLHRMISSRCVFHSLSNIDDTRCSRPKYTPRQINFSPVKTREHMAQVNIDIGTSFTDASNPSNVFLKAFWKLYYRLEWCNPDQTTNERESCVTVQKERKIVFQSCEM